MSSRPDASVADSQRDLPPLPLRLLGRTLSSAIARVPGVWRLLRGPTRRFWERSAAHWDERIEPDRPEHLAPLAAACERIGSQPRRILELGTGTGAGALMLARRFPEAEIVAVDLSEAMVRAAQAKLPPELADRLRFEVADAASLPYDDASFDLVAQLNLPTYFDEVARVLGASGHVIVASSLGPATPYYTPERLLARRFAERGVRALAADSAGGGTYFLAGREAAT